MGFFMTSASERASTWMGRAARDEPALKLELWPGLKLLFCPALKLKLNGNAELMDNVEEFTNLNVAQEWSSQATFSYLDYDHNRTAYLLPSSWCRSVTVHSATLEWDGQLQQLRNTQKLTRISSPGTTGTWIVFPHKIMHKKECIVLEIGRIAWFRWVKPNLQYHGQSSECELFRSRYIIWRRWVKLILWIYNRNWGCVWYIFRYVIWRWVQLILHLYK